MKFIKCNIQNGWMKRVGVRGKYLTIYHHSYEGKNEVTEKFHIHPWKWTISVLYSGAMIDELKAPSVHMANRSLTRRPLFGIIPSVEIYNSNQAHRILSPTKNCRSIFIGIMRRQDEGPNATVLYDEGYGHYTEQSGNIAPSYMPGSYTIDRNY